MRNLKKQFSMPTMTRGLHQVWIWVHGPEGAHLEARWIDNRLPAVHEVKAPHEIQQAPRPMA